jgi:hypothetical protein
MVPNRDSSPFQSSPFNASEGNSSPRLFWQGRDPAIPTRFNSENGIFGQREGSPSPTRRSSIEKLQKASRVKNSNMFAREQKQEYDPTSVPVIERPLAKQVQGNAYGGAGLDGLRAEERGRPFGHKRAESRSSIPLYSPTKTPLASNANGLASTGSPSKDQASPFKSSLASGRFNPKASFDPENGTWSDDNSGDERQLPEGKALHRHAKSVTFDAAPPQINEYEMATPDLSSIGTGSRENSYDSGEEEDDSYNFGGQDECEDSFDASLEDTDKTPVVGPDDWRHASPSTQRGIMGAHVDDPFQGPEGSPMPEAGPSSPLASRPSAARNDSLSSNGDHRPLPPLPGMDSFSNSQPSNGLSAAAERASGSQRNLPSTPKPASISKSDLQGMAGGKMTLEERLRLMMIQDDDKPKSAAEQQRERRMRRAGAKERSSQTPERDNGQIDIYEDEDTLGELGEYQLPSRISRESILRKVNGQESLRTELDYNFSSPVPSSSPERPAPIDPDVPLPSTEDASTIDADADQSVVIKPEPEDEEFDVYSIPEMYQRTESRLDEYDQESLAQPNLHNDEDTESQYSDPTPVIHSPQPDSKSPAEEEGPPTPRPTTPMQEEPVLDPKKEGDRVSLPDFSGLSINTDFGLSLQSYMTPSTAFAKEDCSPKRASMSMAREYLQRPITPPKKPLSLPKPDYDGSGWGPNEDDESDFGTPDSVIRHPLPSAPSPPRDSPSIPEHVATIKSASGSKLKTRPSATPSDLMAMREARRQISGEQPSVPPIPERHRNRPSLNLDRPVLSPDNEAGSDEGVDRKSSFKKKSLTLDIGGDLGLALDKDFDRVIEAQKVAFDLSFSPSNFLYSGDRQVSRCANCSLVELNANITPRKQRGYLMRQNTKLVVASSDVDKATEDSRGTRSAGNSPIKKDRPQSWTVEPWNGQTRKRSTRDNVSPRKKVGSGPAPPLPGFESNVTGLGILTEEEPTLEQNVSENGERGRLFVKVIGVKDLDLPLPKSKSCSRQRHNFELTNHR